MTNFAYLSLEQDSLFFSAEKSSIYQLSKVQTLILQGLNAGFSIEELCESLNDNNETCIEKLYELRAQWLKNGLLKASNRGTDDLPYSHYLLPANETILFSTNILVLYQQITTLYSFNAKNHGKHLYSIQAIQAGNSIEEINIVVNGKHKRTCENIDQALINCIFEITELATHEFPRLFVAHAAAVYCNNNVLLMPTSAGKGKSTLTATLAQNHYQIINDDVVPVNFDGSITAINSPLKIKSGSWKLLASIYPEILVSPMLMRADQQEMKLWKPASDKYCLPGSQHQVTHIIIPEYNPTCVANVCLLNCDSIVRHILQSEPYLPHLITHSYLKAIVQWISKIPAWYITYSNTEEALHLINQIVDSKSYG